MTTLGFHFPLCLSLETIPKKYDFFKGSKNGGRARISSTLSRGSSAYPKRLSLIEREYKCF